LNAHPPLSWKSLSEPEKYIWACAFANASVPEADERARYADSLVYLFRYLPDRDLLVSRNPEQEAAYANAEIVRPDFDIWYRVQMEIKFGDRWDYHRPTDQECEEAFERYRMGLDSYF